MVLTDWYLPAYKAGGPVRSVAALVARLSEKYNFHIITSNKDAFEEQALPVKTDMWISGNFHERIIYLSGKISRERLQKTIGSVRYDYLYINSFFSKTFSIYPLLLVRSGKLAGPVVLAPRGMLREGALAIKSTRKKIFLALSKWRGLHRDLTWHATSAQEEREIKKIYGEKARVILAPNLTLPPLSPRTGYAKRSGELRVCSVTRLVRNKKIDLAIRILRETGEGKIVYDVYGPAEDKDYYAECLALAGSSANLTVNFKGDLPPQEVENALKQHHVFLLPTETENFGHAIVEAMANGCIPVISDQTPWQGLEEQGIGWDLPLNREEDFIRAIRACLSLDEGSFKSQSIRIQEFVNTRVSDPRTLLAYEQLFK